MKRMCGSGRHYHLCLKVPNEYFVRFYCQACKADIFKPTTKNEHLHEITNDIGVVNFIISKI